MSLENTLNKYTDKTIESIPKKMLMVVKQKSGVKTIKNEIKSNQIQFIQIYFQEDLSLGIIKIGSGTEYFINPFVLCSSFYIMLK